MSSMGALMYQVERGAGTRRGAGRHTEKRVPCARGHTLGDSVAREAAGEDDAVPRHLELPGPAQIRHAAAYLGARADHPLREVRLPEPQIECQSLRIRPSEALRAHLELVHPPV